LGTRLSLLEWIGSDEQFLLSLIGFIQSSIV
jgi:hypothetical protein